MKPRFTPGQWNVDNVGNEDIWIFQDNTVYLAMIITDEEGSLYEHDTKKTFANAELMAAAPELLEKLVDMAETVSDLYDIPELSGRSEKADEILEWTKQFYEEEAP